MADTGTTNPGTMADDSSVGTGVWLNPHLAKVEDGVFTGMVLLEDAISHYLKATNFGFTIPSGATIDGIKVEIKQRNIIGPGSSENSIKIVKGGTISGDDKSTSATLPDPLAYVTYGGSSDLWGVTWTPAQINASNFGTVFSVIADKGDAGVPQVDHIRITVFYSKAVFVNKTKSSTTFVNDTKNKSGKTWNEATETWDEATEETWDIQMLNDAKSSTTFTNDSKS